MLDIDFFRAEISLDRPIVYRYRTGRFRPTFKRILSQHPDVAPNFLAFTPDNDDARDGGLFGDSFRYCDWSDAGFKVRAPPISDGLLRELAEGKRTSTADLFRISKALDTQVDWGAVRDHCLVMEEAAINAGSRAQYVDYLLSVSPLVAGDAEDWRPRLDSHLDEVMAGEEVNLNKLAKEIDMYVLAHIDPQTNSMIAEAQIEADTSGLRSVGSCMRRFVETGDTYDLVQLVSAASRHGAGRPGSYLVGELYRSTGRLMFQQIGEHAVRSPGKSRHRLVSRGGFPRQLILWSAMMLGWDERLTWYETESANRSVRGPDNTIVAVENMCREYLERRAQDVRGDYCVADLWAACNVGFQRSVYETGHGLAYHRAKLVELVSSAIGSGSEAKGWVSELGRAASAAYVARERREENESHKELGPAVDSAPSSVRRTYSKWLAASSDPAAFDQIIARVTPGELLRKRVQQKSRPSAILFHGRAGVGKGTTARLFAQAMLCEQTAVNGAPCSRCERCHDVLSGGGFIFGNGRLREYSNEKVTRQKARAFIEKLVEKAHEPSHTHGRVIVIENVALAGDELDGFLKTLESSPILFILTARNLADVRPSVRSRCELYKVKPMDSAGTRAWLKRLLSGRADVDEKTLDVLVALSRGAPGEILRINDALSKHGPITLADVRSTFSLEWPQRLAGRWIDVLETQERGWPDGGVLAEFSPAEKVRRVRAALAHTVVSEGASAESSHPDPALLHLDPQTSDLLRTGFRRAVVRSGMKHREYARKALAFWATYEPLVEHYPESDLRAPS